MSKGSPTKDHDELDELPTKDRLPLYHNQDEKPYATVMRCPLQQPIASPEESANTTYNPVRNAATIAQHSMRGDAPFVTCMQFSLFNHNDSYVQNSSKINYTPLQKKSKVLLQ
ncbi:unnamed protein product [Dovyalis caffra]|uniref:Engrailed n=1 Tax=Dovyalis caffra TaxID=77055 RepID=A0AAV1RRJ7_9ROSI|nr:unnamed protein product [Dovyalis caffra]